MPTSGDCDDSAAAINPDGDDANCNGIDENCDGITDGDYATPETSCGVGACAATGEAQCVVASVVDTCVPGTPSSRDAATVSMMTATALLIMVSQPSRPAAVLEPARQRAARPAQGGVLVDSCTPGTPTSDANCDGIDDDCDGTADDGYVSQSNSCGIGACAATGSTSCVGGSVADSCTPGTPGIEICGNGIDEDCNGSDATCLVWYRDADADTYGDAAVTSSAATQPTGYVANSTDCDDTNANVKPGAVENSSNGIDDNCNGVTDEAGTLTDLLGRWTIVKDNGTVYVANITTICNSGQTCLGSSVSAMWPGGRAMGAREGDGKLVQFGIFDSAPNEWAYFEGTSFSIGSGIKKTDMFPCSFAEVAVTVLGDSYHIASGVKGQIFYQDLDGDTYGNAAVSSYACTGTPAGYVVTAGDCDDSKRQ